MKRFKYRSTLILSLISLGLMAIGFEWGGREGLIWSAVIIVTAATILYIQGEAVLRRSFHSALVEGQDPWRLVRRTKEYAQKCHIGTPQIFLVEQDTPQVFVTGRNMKNNKIFITRGLVERFSEEELEATLAYCCVTISKGLPFTLVSLSAFLAVVTRISFFVDRCLRWLIGSKSQKSDAFQNHLVTFALAPLLTSAVRLVNPPSNYYNADKAAARLLQNEKLMAQVLWKLHSYNMTLPLPVDLSRVPIYIVNPLTNTLWSRYFRTHPPVAKRILKLTGYYPI